MGSGSKFLALHRRYELFEETSRDVVERQREDESERVIEKRREGKRKSKSVQVIDTEKSVE